MVKNVVVTAANDAYFSLLEGMVKSYHKNAKRDDTDLCVIDLGLTGEQRARISDLVERFVTVDWDLDFPCLRDAPEYKKAFTVAPFLPKYFGEYETIVWIDADAWIQTQDGLDIWIEAAKTDKLVVVPELDRSYPWAIAKGKVRTFNNLPLLNGRVRRIKSWLRKGLARQYNREIANKTLFQPALNAGVFAARTSSTCWEQWAEACRIARVRKLSHLSDQLPLNYAVYSGMLEVYKLPSIYNWICDFAMPVWDSELGLFVEPLLPHNPIGIVHLIAYSKRRHGKYAKVVDKKGRPANRSLRFCELDL
jgi:lipopolysaccharide biosynthesis glycosyltransferase